MTPETRGKHMSKVFNTSLIHSSYDNTNTLVPSLHEVMPSTTTAVAEPVAASIGLLVPVDSFVHNVSVPDAVLHGIWNKATELINNPQKIAPAPGCAPNSRMVESKSGNRPHLVTAGKGNKFSCDGDCANFKAFGICSHVVAVASVNQMLPAFLEVFQKQKKLPNLTSLAMAGMPKGRGHKGGKPPRKRNRGASEMRVPFNPIPMSTSVSTGASSTMKLNESSSLSVPFLNNEFSDSPVGSSYFPPVYPTQSYLPCAPSATQVGYYSYCSPPLQSQSHSQQQQSCSFNLLPPPLVSLQPTPTLTNVNTQNVSGSMCNVIVSQTTAEPSNERDIEDRPFNLYFISGNISRCAGCKKKYSKPPIVPNDLCIQHEEWRQLTFPNSSSPSTIFSNVYYHPSLFCIKANWPHFMPSQLVISPSVHARLFPQHWDLLHRVFGIQKTSWLYNIWISSVTFSYTLEIS